MNEKGLIRIKEEKSRLSVALRGSKMSVLKLHINEMRGRGGPDVPFILSKIVANNDCVALSLYSQVLFIFRQSSYIENCGGQQYNTPIKNGEQPATQTTKKINNYSNYRAQTGGTGC